MPSPLRFLLVSHTEKYSSRRLLAPVCIFVFRLSPLVCHQGVNAIFKHSSSASQPSIHGHLLLARISSNEQLAHLQHVHQLSTNSDLHLVTVLLLDAKLLPTELLLGTSFFRHQVSSAIQLRRPLISQQSSNWSVSPFVSMDPDLHCRQSIRLRISNSDSVAYAIRAVAHAPGPITC